MSERNAREYWIYIYNNEDYQLRVVRDTPPPPKEDTEEFFLVREVLPDEQTEIERLRAALSVAKDALVHYECSHYDGSGIPCGLDDTASNALKEIERIEKEGE